MCPATHFQLCEERDDAAGRDTRHLFVVGDRPPMDERLPGRRHRRPRLKVADSKYKPGRRTWIKVKSRETSEVLIGGITGVLERPDRIVAGLVRDGELHVVGRSTPLTTT
jgi:hypothetical protein